MGRVANDLTKNLKEVAKAIISGGATGTGKQVLLDSLSVLSPEERAAVLGVLTSV